MVSFHCVCTVGQGCGLSSVSQMLLVIRSRACKVYDCAATGLLHCNNNPFVVWREVVKRKSCARVMSNKVRQKHVTANLTRECLITRNLGEYCGLRKYERRIIPCPPLSYFLLGHRVQTQHLERF